MLTEKQFADLYAQTITYGLFAARTRAEHDFNRKLAFTFIPHTVGILRDVFQFISLGDSPKPLQMIVDDISEVLKVTDVKNILQTYFREGKGKDPIIHFYETFLAAYDPSIRERRGVYYTPEAVVNYIVKSLHLLLKTNFGLADGLAGKNVTLLDPAAGTLTFPAEALKIAVTEYTEKYGEGGKYNFIKKQILPNFFAFELMMAPYAIGHLKMSFLLEELGYRLADDERFNLYLTNTLELDELEQISIPGLSSLSDESHLAGKVKKEQPILVVFGNPPYSGISLNLSEKKVKIKTGQKYVGGYDWNQNKNQVQQKILYSKKDINKFQKTFIGDILMEYYFVDGKPLGEKNPKWLQDDYVKFLRFAQWKIEKAGFGLVGMITNHSYLDNPTFRGMRQSLMKTFSEIYILDLHGNSLKKETAPDGGKDENVFDIRQGVAIALFIKRKDKKGCKVYHTDLYGLREHKYNWLFETTFVKKNYTEIKPQSPYYFFIRRTTQSIQYYLDWKKVNEIFLVNSVGIVTARDKLTIRWTENDLWNTVQNFSRLDVEIARRAYLLGNDVRDWRISFAQKDLKESGLNRENIKPILYRPFDIRYTYYTGKSRGFHCMPRRDVMRHMLEGKNMAITLGRQVKASREWRHCLIASKIIESSFISDKTSEITYLFPLYLYTAKEENNPKPGVNLMMVFEPHAPYFIRKANIDPKIYEKIEKVYGEKPAPEDILYYIYGIFYSNTYRTKYAEFLKIDFPRVPFTANYKGFKKVAAYGKQLTELHLLKSEMLNKPISKYRGRGDNDRIEKIRYIERQNCVYINNDKYFDGIASELWNYHIGGYQVLYKFLKDRKDRVMDDPRHYSRVVTAISKTIALQKQIDKIYNHIEKELIEF